MPARMLFLILMVVGIALLFTAKNIEKKAGKVMLVILGLVLIVPGAFGFVVSFL